MWCVIDLETTGLDPKHDKIIEIGAVKVGLDGVLETFQVLLDPGVALTPFIVELTGINDDMLVGQATIDEVMPEFIEFVGDCVPVAHNASFEASFLQAYTGWAGDEWLDSITLTKLAFPYLGSYSLESLVAALELANTAPHRALADAQATALLLNRVEVELRRADPCYIAALIDLFSTKHVVYAEFLRPFADDFSLPAYAPPTPAIPSGEALAEEEDYSIDSDELLALLDGEHGVNRLLDDFQSRDAQTEMTRRVAEAFNTKSFLLAEAGTGTGKTIAYLLPAALLSLHGGRRVTISTHTIHLQDQLLQKDIPLINRLFGNKLHATLVKGRNHYLCYRKWALAAEDEEKELAFFMARLLPWVLKTTDGDVDTLQLTSFERREWYRFSAASDSCLGGHCPYYRSKCFVHRVRREAERAHLIVINHSLLLTDSMMTGGVLPPSDYLIVDEAHQLDKVAEETMGGTLTYFDHTSVLGDLRRFLQRLEKRCAIGSLFSREPNATKEQALEQLRLLIAAYDGYMSKGELYFKELRRRFESFRDHGALTGRAWRIDRRTRESELWSEPQILLDNYCLALQELCRSIDRVGIDFAAELEEEGSERERFQYVILKSRLAEIAATANLFSAAEEQEMVAWLEAGNERALYPVMKLSPLAVGEALALNLYDKKESVIFVSATLSVAGKFNYFKQNCGLDLIARPCDELLLPSPFDYEKQAILLCAGDMPMPNSVGEFSFIESVSDALIRMVTASGGRALALFTSHMQLREVYARIRAPLAEQGVTVLAHELSGSRTALLAAMREGKRTLILGANSFWEGIDVAGDSLSLLIIVKLPFWPPDMPTVAARSERLEAQGKNAFYEFSLPQAVIRFKQGFGRLLRKEDDRGVICVLDRRLCERRYGKSFLKSLPLDQVYPMSVADIATLIENKL